MTFLKSITVAVLGMAITLGLGCKKTIFTPPKMNFIIGTGYISSDATVSRNQTIKIGIIADKVKEDMNTFHVSYSYDNAFGSTITQTFALTGTEQQHFEKDITFNTRNITGTEKWYFTVTDKGGNVAEKLVILTIP